VIWLKKESTKGKRAKENRLEEPTKANKTEGRRKKSSGKTGAVAKTG